MRTRLVAAMLVVVFAWGVLTPGSARASDETGIYDTGLLLVAVMAIIAIPIVIIVAASGSEGDDSPPNKPKHAKVPRGTTDERAAPSPNDAASRTHPEKVAQDTQGAAITLRFNL